MMDILSLLVTNYLCIDIRDDGYIVITLKNMFYFVISDHLKTIIYYVMKS